MLQTFEEFLQRCRAVVGHLVAATQDMVGMEMWPHSVEETERFIDEHKSFMESVFAERTLVELEKDSEHIEQMLDNSHERNRYVFKTLHATNLHYDCNMCHW